jgi:hypothetical protein
MFTNLFRPQLLKHIHVIVKFWCFVSLIRRTRRCQMFVEWFSTQATTSTNAQKYYSLNHKSGHSGNTSRRPFTCRSSFQQRIGAIPFINDSLKRCHRFIHLEWCAG